MAKSQAQLVAQAEAMAGMSKEEIAEHLKGKGFSAKEVDKISEMAAKVANGESIAPPEEDAPEELSENKPAPKAEAPKAEAKKRPSDPRFPRWDLIQLRRNTLEEMYVINKGVTLPQHLVDIENAKSENTLRKYVPARG